VKIAYVNAHERTAALESLRAFVADVAALPRTAEVEVAESDTRCEPVVAETGP
jgi:hypothetical protein